MSNTCRVVRRRDLFDEPETPDDTASHKFEWDDDITVIPEQPKTAVYFNRRGQVVIRQQDGALDGNDPFVFVSIEHLPVLIAALQRCLEGDGE